MKTKRSIAWVMSLSLLAGQAQAVRAAGQSAPSAPSAIMVQGKMDTSTGELLIPVEFDSARFWCALDSGFSALIAVDQGYAEKAGLRIAHAIPTPDGRSPGGGDAGSTATLTVGGVSFGEQSLILRRLAAEAPEMECIMGVGVLKRFVVELDYAAARVRLYDRATYRPLEGTQQVPLLFRTNLNVPFVQMTLTFADGARQLAQVVPDTGTAYFAAAFVSPFMQRIRPRIPRTALPAIRNDSSRPTLKLDAARLAAISVGPFTVREPVVALMESGIGPGIDDGTLGSGFFRRFTVAFDFEGRVMHLRPNNRIAERQLFDASGVALEKNATGFEVDFVLTDSAAERAGLRSGDRLLEVGGRPSETFTLVELRDLLSHPGEILDLRLVRGVQMLRIMLKLEERL